MSVDVAVEHGRMTITMADDERRNALGAELVAQILDALARANGDDRVRVVVLTNRGRVFSAGADLKARSADRETAAASAGIDQLLAGIRSSPTPVVGRVDGHAFGGGLGLVAACDIAVAREDASFGFTEVRLGVAPAMISVVCLPLMRRREALEAFLRGTRFDGTRAAELGLLTRAVPAERLDEEVDRVVEDLLLGAPGALAAAKQLVNEVPSMGADDALAWTTQLSGRLFSGEEAAEGMAAFRERRRPDWSPPE